MASACLTMQRHLTRLLKRLPAGCQGQVYQGLHTSSVSLDRDRSSEDTKDFMGKMNGLDEYTYKGQSRFVDYNQIVYEPRKEGEDPRPAEICHKKVMIAVTPKKMWYPAFMVRGLSIDEAITQCEFSKKAAPKIIKDVLIEAQERAIKFFNVEYKSNLWIADSFVERCDYMESLVRRSRGGIRKIKYEYSNYYVRLREGQPPKHYYAPRLTGNEQLEEYIKEQRNRRIYNGL
ncbi:39S ribosomal protein L22, mitochondrial-like [Mya arenaria]|uniref:39S ribosomal protein L22, mitochondrial-like n=1 Tax=Mya arenaria TaxID=6604 RepID=UPI0022E5EEE5|nr:39S ribosomal protein L22, mitochondrial-like [Mya arenaria]